MKQQDQTPDIRWLNEKQEARLRTAIDARDTKLRGLASVPLDVSTPDKRAAWESKFADAPAFGDHLKPIVLLMLDCGLRRQEALQLRWDDIKPDAVRDDQFQLFIRPSSDKTGKGRYVPLIRETAVLLHQWRQHLKTTGRQSLWVFPNPKTGEPFKEVKSSWNTLISLASKSMRSLQGTTLRDLRSTYGSKLVQRGVPILQVSKLLGHSSVTITERHYAALSDQGKREAVDTLSRLGDLSVVDRDTLLKRGAGGD
jgi:integrase